MKKIVMIVCALVSAISAFAYYGDSSHSNGMSGFTIFTLMVMIAYIILSIFMLIRWWDMTKNVEEIRQRLTPDKPKLTYLVAIGEKEQAQKAAIAMLVDLLYPIYLDPYENTKAEAMNRVIEELLPKMQMLGLTLLDYVTTGEKFIDYINKITDGKVPYSNF